MELDSGVWDANLILLWSLDTYERLRESDVGPWALL